MANPLDIFDAPKKAANPFDQFDKPANPFDVFDKNPSASAGDALYAQGDASAALDHYFTHSPAGRILDSVFQGASHGWGSEPVGVSPDTEDFLRKSGVWNDYTSGQQSVTKALNEAFMRPAAAGLEAALRGGSALFGAAQGLTEQAFTEAGMPRLGRDIAAMPEAFQGSPGMFHPRVERAPGRAEAVKSVAEEEKAATPPTGAPQEEAAPRPVAVEPTPTGEATPVAGAPEAPPKPAFDISGDVSRKLVDAGRPQEEADAAAALVNAHYEARAARFDGAKGDAGDLYQAEAPDIVGRPAAEGRKGEMGRTVFDDAKATITLFRNADASTFIHETGHGWLEELMRDAADEKAPDQLKADADTVREWVGAEQDANLTTRQHEKFARGFERYMMEGVAPEPQLAGVFAQFKQWLTSIYQTVSRLRAPISDGVRQVFDRMISAEPQPVTVEPEAIERHEASVAGTPPHEASATADRVRQDIESLASQRGVQDELAGRQPAEPAGGGAAEAGGGPPEGVAADRNAGPARPIPENERVPEPVGAAVEGRGAAAPQGDVAPSKPEPAPDPIRPSDPFGDRESAYLDKAGNIRLDNLNTPESVNDVIREAAAANNEFMSERRGVLTDAEVVDLADAIGMTPATLDRRKIGQAFNAEEIMAARKLLVDSATAVRDAAAKAEDGADTSLLSYAQARDRHVMIQGQVSGITAEAGRSLRAFRALEGSKEAGQLGLIIEQSTGRTLYQLRREAQAVRGLDDPNQVSSFINDAAKPDFWDKLLFYRANSLISGLATHSTYLAASELFALWRATAETAMAAGIGVARQAVGIGGEERVRIQEVPGGLYGFLVGQRRGLRAGWENARDNLTNPLPGETEGGQVMAGSTMQPYAYRNPLAGGRFPVVGEVIGAPGRAVAGIHGFNSMVGYQTGIHQLAYRAAAEEGLAGDAFADRVAQFLANPPEGAMTEAANLGRESAMMGKTGDFTNLLTQLANKRIMGAPLLKLVFPFIRIGSFITSEALFQRTPLGFFDQTIRDNLLGENGDIARDTQIARIATGIAMGGAVIGLASQGLVTGGGPSDPKEAAVWRDQGHQPYSINIGGIWHSLHRLGPLAMLFGLYADAHEIWHAAAADETTSNKLTKLVFHSIEHNLLGESWMRGAQDVFKAVDDQNHAEKFADNFLSSFVPFSIFQSQMARALDPYAREAHGLVDTIKSHTPFLSTSLPPRIGVWGQPIPNYSAFPMAGVSAIYQTRANNDPVDRALQSAGIYPESLPKSLEGVQLNDAQHENLLRMAGTMSKQQLNVVVANPAFDTYPTGVRQQMLKDAINRGRRMGEAQVKLQILRDNPTAFLEKRVKRFQ